MFLMPILRGFDEVAFRSVPPCAAHYAPFAPSTVLPENTRACDLNHQYRAIENGGNSSQLGLHWSRDAVCPEVPQSLVGVTDCFYVRSLLLELDWADS